METAATTITQLDGIRLSDWVEARGLSRSTAYELLKLLQIEPEARRVPTSRKPVSHLTADQVEMLDPLAAEINRGATLPQIRDRLGQCGIVPADSPERSAIVPDSSPGSSAIVPDKTPGQLVALSTEQFTGLLEVLQRAAVSVPPAPAPVAVAAVAPAVDPLVRARGLAEAAKAGLPLENKDLSALVGTDTSSWKDRRVQYGYRFHKRHQLKDDGTECSAVIWLVERDASLSIGGQQQSPAALQPAPVEHGGFAGLFEEMARPAAYLAPPVEATYRVMGRELFSRNRIG